SKPLMALVWAYRWHNVHNRFLSHPSIAIHIRGDFNMGQHKADIAAAFEKIGETRRRNSQVKHEWPEEMSLRKITRNESTYEQARNHRPAYFADSSRRSPAKVSGRAA